MSNLVEFNKYITHGKTSEYLQKVLGSKKESFVTNCASLVSNNVDLQGCSPNSIIYSAIKATALELPLDANLGFAYVLPYSNNKLGIKEAQFQIGYKGFIQLAQRTGKYKTISVSDVREGEYIETDRLTGETEFRWIKDNDLREERAVIGYVAYFELLGGFSKSLFMTVKKLEAHGKKYSKSYNSNSSNWKNMFDSMASKTVLKLLLSKYAPLSIQLAEAQKFDQAVIRSETEFQYIDNDRTIDVASISETEETERILRFIHKATTIEDIKSIRESLSDDLNLKFQTEIENAENNIILNSQTQNS